MIFDDVKLSDFRVFKAKTWFYGNEYATVTTQVAIVTTDDSIIVSKRDFFELDVLGYSHVSV